MRVKFKYQHLDRPLEREVSTSDYESPGHAWAELVKLEVDGARISDIQVDGRYVSRDDLKLLAERE